MTGPRSPWLLLGIAAVVWGALCWRLGLDGRLPSGPTPLGADHYRLQAVGLFGALPLAALASGWVARRRLGGAAAPPLRPHPAAALGVAALVLSVSEWGAYAAGGWSGLQAVAPASGLLALLTLFGLHAASARGRGATPLAAAQTAAGMTLAVGLVLAPLVR